MKKTMAWTGLLAAIILGGLGYLLQANFIQCPGGSCNGTIYDDLINGTPFSDEAIGLPGNDIMFGLDGQDQLEGADGNDIAFGGLGSDIVRGDLNDDILLAGPDEPNFGQEIFGGPNNDTAHVFAGEVTECLLIYGDAGHDVVNLVGFGPYIGISPFSENSFNGFDTGFITVIDPIAGGTILIFVSRVSDTGTEIINGLINPNVVVEESPQSASDCASSIPNIE